MITINYDNTNKELFSFAFNKMEYIPPSFNIKFPKHPELEFYKSIMDRHPKVMYVSTEVENYSTFYNYSIDGKVFSIVSDDDYDYVYFSTEIRYREAIAEYLCNIIERHHGQAHYDL